MEATQNNGKKKSKFDFNFTGLKNYSNRKALAKNKGVIFKRNLI